MTESIHRVFVNILEREYQVACQPHEKDELLAAARELDQRMRKARNTSSIIGIDRIAVMVALNLCHELQQLQAASSERPADSQVLEALVAKLDAALDTPD